MPPIVQPTGTCAKCHEPIAWAVTVKGKRQPIDAERYDRDDHHANLAVYFDAAKVLKARTLKRGEDPYGYESRAMPHFATCKAARDPEPVTVGFDVLTKRPAGLPAGVVPFPTPAERAARKAARRARR